MLQLQNCPCKQPTYHLPTTIWAPFFAGNSQQIQSWLKFKATLRLFTHENTIPTPIGENCYTLGGHDNIITSNEAKKGCWFRLLSVNGRVRMLIWKFRALILNATISSRWWGKCYKGHLRMNLEGNSTLFLLFKCVTRETGESFASRTYALLAETVISIGDVNLSIAKASMHYVTVCVNP